MICPSCGEENPERARFCLACGATLEAQTTAEERKVVSVLFVDLVGFTNRSDRADPEDVRATLRPYHERLKEEIEAFGGTVEKFIGDAVMAVFGAPIAHEDDAERAVRAGLRILDAIEELNEENPSFDLAVRGAVTTGEAVVALAARPERGEGIATGDVVNVAARLQGAAPVGSVLADEATVRSTADAIDYEELEPVVAKGKSEPIAVWRATGARSRFGVDTELAARTPLVGRERDLAVLVDAFERVRDEPSVQLVTVVGEPGLGKSRLVWELGRAVDALPELVRWRQGRCLPYGEGITFWALGEIVKADAGILESDSPGDARAKLERAVAAAIPDESERAWYSDRLAPLVGSQEETAGVAREEAFSAWRRYFEALTADGPLVLVFEDLHWADGALLDFLENLLDWAPAIPLLVVGTARPELYAMRTSWGGGRRNSTTVGLAPLSDEETARLVSGLLERAVLPAETQSMLLERAGGNPLYTEQFVRMLAEAGAAADVKVPETVQALIAARLDTLEPELKSLLQNASVLGKVFWSGVLADMGGRDRESVLGGLRELVRREFVRPARVSSMRGEEEFSFWHVLVRDVAYQQIPRAARAQKHIQAASWIEARAEDRVSDQAEILVHHYEQALELGRAAGEPSASGLELTLARFLILAGDRAMHLDMSAAEAAYRRALELTEGSPSQSAALVRLADAQNEQGRLHEAAQTYEEAVGALRAAGDELSAARGMVGLARALWRLGRTAQAREVILEAIPILEREPGPDLLVAYERAASIDALGGRSHEGMAWAEKGIALGREQGIENVVRHLQFRGISRNDLGDPAGVDDLQQALELALRLDLGIETGSSYLNLAEALLWFEPLSSARDLLERSLALSRRKGLVHHEMWTRMSINFHRWDLGEWDELLAEADALARWDKEQGGSQIYLASFIFSAIVLAHRGDFEGAERYVEESLEPSRATGDPQAVVPAVVSAATVRALGGNPAEALALVREFEQLTEELPNWRGQLLSPAIRVCVAIGEVALGERLRDGATGAMPGLLTRAEQATAAAMLAEARGRPAEAEAGYREALELWSEWGSLLERAYAQLGLGRCGDAAAGREGAAFFERLRAVPVTALAA